MGRRLKSLDEFEPPYWKGAFRLPERSRVSPLIVAVGFAIGVAVGIAILI